MAQAMGRIADQPLLHRPGTAWQYSIATDVLGAVIEKATGISLPSAVQQAVTGPLGMTQTSFVAASGELAAAYADGVERPTLIDGMIRIITQSGEAFPAEPSRALNPASYPSGGAGLIGTAGDYLTFLEAIRCRNSILSPGLWDMAVTDQLGGLQRIPASPGAGFGFLGSVIKDPVLAETAFSPTGKTRVSNVPHLDHAVDAAVFSLSARVSVDFQAVYDAGAIFIASDEENWAKIAFEFSAARKPTIVSVVTRTTSDDADGPRFDGQAAYLRVYCEGECIALHFSDDGTTWRFLRWFTIPNAAARPIRIGLGAQSPTGNGVMARFSDVKLSFDRIDDLRNGA